MNCIMLVDDDLITNQINKYYIEKTGVASHTQVAENGQIALGHINGSLQCYNQKEGCGHPDLIILDINMPRMSGWEFLDEYQKYYEKKRAKVIMLSASINPDDKKRAEQIETEAALWRNHYANQKLIILFRTFLSLLKWNYRIFKYVAGISSSNSLFNK